MKNLQVICLLLFFRVVVNGQGVFQLVSHIGWEIYRPSVCVYLWPTNIMHTYYVLPMNIIHVFFVSPTDVRLLLLLLLFVAALFHLASLIYGHTYTHTWCICISPQCACILRWRYFSLKRPKKKRKISFFFDNKFEKFVERLIEIIALLGDAEGRLICKKRAPAGAGKMAMGPAKDPR